MAARTLHERIAVLVFLFMGLGSLSVCLLLPTRPGWEMGLARYLLAAAGLLAWSAAGCILVMPPKYRRRGSVFGKEE